GAEAWYHIARIQYGKGEYKEVEKTISKLVGFAYSNDTWNNRGMLLLVDAYIAAGEYADASVIIESIVGSQPGPEFVEEAEKRRVLIEQKEAEQAPKPPEEEEL